MARRGPRAAHLWRIGAVLILVSVARLPGARAGAAAGLAVGDYDGDGDVDLAFGNMATTGPMASWAEAWQNKRRATSGE